MDHGSLEGGRQHRRLALPHRMRHEVVEIQAKVLRPQPFSRSRCLGRRTPTPRYALKGHAVARRDNGQRGAAHLPAGSLPELPHVRMGTANGANFLGEAGGSVSVLKPPFVGVGPEAIEFR